tara:strand:+ start:92 stop:841 length:750 start_codon:yes stop_codon:yes gene_type:complete
MPEYTNSLDTADLIVDACVKYDLLPAKRKTQQVRDLVAGFRKKIKNNKQFNSQVMIDLCLSLIKDKSRLNDTIETNYAQEFKDIVNSEGFLTMSIEDICVCLSNQKVRFLAERKTAVEDLYNEREESKRIIEMKNKRLEELSKENTQLKRDLMVSEETRKNQFDKLLEYDSDCEEDTYQKGDIYGVPLIQHTDLVEEEEEEEPIKYDSPDQSEEEEEINDKAAEEAKLFFKKLEAENEEKRIANRKRFN